MKIGERWLTISDPATAAHSGATARAQKPHAPHSQKWLAFSAIGISFVTMVMSMSMVFVALSAIADDFGITLLGGHMGRGRAGADESAR